LPRHCTINKNLKYHFCLTPSTSVQRESVSHRAALLRLLGEPLGGGGGGVDQLVEGEQGALVAALCLGQALLQLVVGVDIGLGPTGGLKPLAC
jgi:hypothetical protein